tara:strand:+ start:153 stop:374 length:222 start_codon:yes stop_codon:yes gene_type:complete
VKITQKRLNEIILEEIKKVLNEKTIRTSGDLDIIIHNPNHIQLISSKGRTKLTKKDVRYILSGIRQLLPSAFN